MISSINHPLTKLSHVTLLDTLQYSYLLREKGSAVRDITDSILHTNNMDIIPLWESISTHAIIQGVKSNLGISILPYRMVQDEIKNQTIQEIHLAEFSFSRQCSIIYHKNKYLSETCKKFIDVCIKKGSE